jgi:hypothetical protein
MQDGAHSRDDCATLKISEINIFALCTTVGVCSTNKMLSNAHHGEHVRIIAHPFKLFLEYSILHMAQKLILHNDEDAVRYLPLFNLLTSHI